MNTKKLYGQFGWWTDEYMFAKYYITFLIVFEF